MSKTKEFVGYSTEGEHFIAVERNGRIRLGMATAWAFSDCLSVNVTYAEESKTITLQGLRDKSGILEIRKPQYHGNMTIPGTKIFRWIAAGCPQGGRGPATGEPFEFAWWTGYTKFAADVDTKAERVSFVLTDGVTTQGQPRPRAAAARRVPEAPISDAEAQAMSRAKNPEYWAREMREREELAKLQEPQPAPRDRDYERLTNRLLADAHLPPQYPEDDDF